MNELSTPPNAPNRPEDSALRLSCYFVGCTAFILIGVLMVLEGDIEGWFGIVFFGVALIIRILEPSLQKSQVERTFKAIITDDLVGCENPKGNRRTIQWTDVSRVFLVTTSDGPWAPDVWLYFIGLDDEELPIPTEAEGFSRFFDILGTRLPGFNFEPFIQAGTDDEVYQCWPPAKD